MGDSAGNPISMGFLAGTTVECATPRLTWKTDKAMWVDQWSQSAEKLRTLESLVEEQLSKGHIVTINSPWNSPVFVVKKPGKDR